MAEIGVVVTKNVRLDRDGVRAVLRAFADYLNHQVLSNKDRIEQDDVDTFLKRYASLQPGAKEKD